MLDTAAAPDMSGQFYSALSDKFLTFIPTRTTTLNPMSLVWFPTGCPLVWGPWTCTATVQLTGLILSINRKGSSSRYQQHPPHLATQRQHTVYPPHLSPGISLQSPWEPFLLRVRNTGARTLEKVECQQEGVETTAD